MSHYLVDKYAEKMLLPKEFLNEFLLCLKWDDLNAPKTHTSTTVGADSVRTHIPGVKF
jgi:hypothetical protein